ncbi:ArnT family glycosyltransferase [Paenibacillus sp. 1001270B_150601_E10]|uniref:ArnT family glycosyltransferase n=1 Tax=Paenibacillus sp. 1001270B_150601_E10 TaxID=2787079 RepID=UPI00189E87F4|nr:glycosyltransferase family 39 protein [Paenibacillus sp. 1001270B_150601_E10]
MLNQAARFSSSKRWIVIALIIVIFALASFLRIDFLVSVEHKVSHDSVHYDLMVRQLLEKGVYAYKDTEPNAKVTPGYPLFMAAIYKLVDYQHHDPFPTIRYTQVVISLISLWLLYLIAKRLGGTTVGIVALFIGAVYPPFVWSNAAVLTEVLATLFFMIYVYLQLIVFEKKTWTHALLSGAAMGLLVLTRPEFLILLLPIYAFYYFWKKEKRTTLKLFLITVIGTGIVLSPWVIRNMVTLHEVVIASTQVNPFHAGTYPNKNYDDGLVDRKGKTQMEIAKERLKVGFTEHTWEYTKWYTYGKLKQTYSKMYFGSGHEPRYQVIPILPWNWPHMALIFFALVSLVVFARKWRQPATMLAVILVTMSIVRLAFVPEYRYNYTVMPFIIIMDSIVGVAMVRMLVARYRKNTPLSAERSVHDAQPSPSSPQQP